MLACSALCSEADFQDLSQIGCTILDLSNGLRSHQVILLMLHEPLEGQGTPSQAKVECLCCHKRNAVRLQGLCIDNTALGRMHKLFANMRPASTHLYQTLIQLQTGLRVVDGLCRQHHVKAVA